MTAEPYAPYTGRLGDGTLAIFLFHGVVERSPYAVRNYTRKHLEKDAFAGLLRALKGAGGVPVSMEDVVAAHEAGTALPPRAFAVTFDDGFENNLTVAAPVLADLEVPATFYVTSGFIGEHRMSWIDRIEFAMEDAPPGALRLPWGTAAFSDAASRHRLLDEIRLKVKSDPACDAHGLASDIQAQLGLEPVFVHDSPLDRKMTWAQVAELNAPDLFIVGGHSHTHAILAFLPEAELEAEIATSERLLRENAGVTCRHYSYPEGLAHCYSDRVIAVLKRHGTVCCPTAIDGVNPPGTDLFHLRRVMVI